MQALAAMQTSKLPSGKLVSVCGGTSYVGPRYEGGGWWAAEFDRTMTQTGGRLSMGWNEESNIAQFFEVPIGC